ncbi:hypothetical protein, partial [Oceanospirillum beijerinckii]|uniref:flagellin N-terminal helical domain-containing protein n=1 Tax=Oceanospirillum beijerinckii TaxID=64976 RepID=UPI0006872D9E
MAMYVNTNVSSLSGQRNLQNVTDRMNSSFEKLSSGSRINSAKDDAAGLQISDRLSTQITGLNQANRNASDALSIAQIAEGALSEITNNVQRMRQLVVQGGNRTLSSDDRAALGDEFKKLLSTNDSISERTSYGTIKLLNYDSQEAGFQVQSGAQAGEQDTVTTGNAKLTSLFGDMLNAEGATGAMSQLILSTGGQQSVAGIVESALADMGTLGKLVGAHMLQNGGSIVSVALDALFVGTQTSADFENLNVSDLATHSALQLDTDVLTNLLTTDMSATAGSVGDIAVILALSNAAADLINITSADMIGNSTAGASVDFEAFT